MSEGQHRLREGIYLRYQVEPLVDRIAVLEAALAAAQEKLAQADRKIREAMSCEARGRSL